MKQASFESRNHERWEAFERQIEVLEPTGDLAGIARRVRQAFRGRGSENREEEGAATSPVSLASFPSRYREVCRDLAVASQRRYSAKLVARLNEMAVAGHRHLYWRSTDYLRQSVRFFAWDFPRAVRRRRGAMGLAALAFWLPAVAIAAVVWLAPELVYSVLDAGMVRSLESMYDPGADDRIGSLRTAEDDIAMFGYYIANNIGVSFRCFAAGIVFAVGSLFFLVLNGCVLGAAAAHMIHSGYETTFFSFVIGHGAPELTAIVISGGAGMLLGDALLAPGTRGRRHALRERAQQALPLMLGVIGMLVFAALLEAFWSSKAVIAPQIKYAVGALLWSLVLLYFTFAGRRR